MIDLSCFGLGESTESIINPLKQVSHGEAVCKIAYSSVTHGIKTYVTLLPVNLIYNTLSSRFETGKWYLRESTEMSHVSSFNNAVFSTVSHSISYYLAYRRRKVKFYDTIIAQSATAAIFSIPYGPKQVVKNALLSGLFSSVLVAINHAM